MEFLDEGTTVWCMWDTLVVQEQPRDFVGLLIVGKVLRKSQECQNIKGVGYGTAYVHTSGGAVSVGAVMLPRVNSTISAHALVQDTCVCDGDHLWANRDFSCFTILQRKPRATQLQASYRWRSETAIKQMALLVSIDWLWLDEWRIAMTSHVIWSILSPEDSNCDQRHLSVPR